MASDLVDRLRGVKSSQAIKVPCRVATTANITLSGEQTIDGVAVVEGDRVLVKNQSTGSENGIYEVKTSTWRRAPDWDGVGDVVTGTRVYVAAGTANKGEWVVTTTGTIAIGTTSVAFAGGSFFSDVNTSDDITEGSTKLLMTVAERDKLNGTSDDITEGSTKLLMTVAERDKLEGIPDSILSEVVDDPTPQLGGNLDMNGFQIQASGVSINPIGKQTVVIPAAAWAPTITNGASRSYAELPTNDIISETLDFDTATQEFATFEWFPPQRWNGGTVTFRFRWRSDGGTAAQTVEMALSGRAIADDQFEDGAFGTAVAVSDALIATTDHHVSSESSAVTIGNTPGKGRKVALKLQRNVSNDDLSVDAKIEAIELFFTTDAATDA